MSFVRFRQPIVTRITPHNANKRFIVPNRLPGKQNPLPDRSPFDWDWASAGALGSGASNIIFDLNKPGDLHLEFFCYDGIDTPSNAHLLNATPNFVLFIQPSGLNVQLNNETITICAYSLIGNNRFHELVLEWSISATPGRMDFAAYVDGNQVAAGTFPQLTGAINSMVIGNNAAKNAPFNGVLRNLGYRNEKGFYGGYRIDEGAGVDLALVGSVDGSNGVLSPDGSGQDWYDLCVGVAAITSNAAAGTVSQAYIDCVQADGMVTPDCGNITAWEVLINDVGVPVTEVIFGNDYYYQVHFTATAYVVGQTLEVRYNKYAAIDKTSLANFPSFRKRISLAAI